MVSLRQLTFRQTTVLLLGCIAFVLGIGLARTGQLIDASWFWLCMPAALFNFRKKTLWSACWVIAFGLSLGWWRGSVYVQKLDAYRPYFGHKITLLVRADQDAVYDKNKQLSFNASDVHVRDTGQKLAGRISLSGFGSNAVYEGDSISVSGKLYPTLGANQARMSFAQMQVLGHHATFVDDIRRRFTAGVQSALPEPLASFGMGLLIGQRNTLPESVKQDLLMVGLTHIIAVSGYNLTIILRASKGVLGKRSKRLSTFVSLSLIMVFLLLAGSSASIVRAAIVSVLSIAAGYYGRTFKPLLLIMLAAAITSFASPFYVWSDISWYLSFLAFYGVMVLAPMIASRIHLRWQNSLVAMVALESLCAELMTFPFILHTFGQISLVGLISNVMVVALVPLAMLLTLIAGLAGMLAAPVAGWFAWPARIILTYMLDIAHILAGIPHIFIGNLSLPLVEMLLLYMMVAALSLVVWRKTKALKPATITDKKA